MMRTATPRFGTLALLALLALASARPAGAGLALSEILAGPARDWDGSGAFSSRDDEWIEVLNAGPGDLDLSEFLITDGDSIPRLALAGTLAAGARLVAFGKQSYDWERAHGFPAFGFSLGNSGDQVLLWRIVGTDTTLVDGYAYRSHEAAADRSVGRQTEGGAWELYDALNPYTGTLPPPGNHCEPSPGVANTCGITPARSISWSRIKELYR